MSSWHKPLPTSLRSASHFVPKVKAQVCKSLGWKAHADFLLLFAGYEQQFHPNLSHNVQLIATNFLQFSKYWQNIENFCIARTGFTTCFPALV